MRKFIDIMMRARAYNSFTYRESVPCHTRHIGHLILSGLDVKRHVFRPEVYVHNVLHQGSVIEVWWIVICTIWNQNLMVFILVSHSDV